MVACATVATPAPKPKPTEPPQPQRTQATVVRVIDGDTIEVRIGAQTYNLRYIGIDTPETVDPRRAVQCFGQEASNKNKELMSGKTVGLEKDVSETDRYGRLLRYVYVDGGMVNAELVRSGYAKASSYPPDVRYQDLFGQLEGEARDAGRGLWATNACLTPAAPTATLGRNCDPSYPDVCIPPPPPDLDCKDVPYKRFRVLAPDPHRFDGNKGGIGCET